VDDALWARVKARQSASALPRGENRGKAMNRANRPRHRKRPVKSAQSVAGMFQGSNSPMRLIG
jgi:hypothetical protein